MYATRLFISVIALTAVLAGATVSGPGYLALSLDGATSFSIPSDASALAGKAFTFESWVSVSTIGNQMAIASRINSSSSNPTDAQNDFSLQINAQGYVILALGGITEYGFLLPSGITIKSNVWYHIAFTIEYINLAFDAPYRASLYIDDYSSGKAVRDIQVAYWYGPGYSRVALTNEVITVGKYINSANPSGIFFSGSMDEVRLWNGARTPSDIKAYSFVSLEIAMDSPWAFATPKGTSAQFVVASYNFNKGATSKRATSSVEDQSPYQLAATIQGTASFVADPNQFLQYVRVSGQVPAVIPLYGLDSTTSSTAGIQFVAYWDDSELQGELFAYDSKNSGKPINTHPMTPPMKKDQVGLGAMVAKNSLIDITEKSIIVYVANDNFAGSNARLRYYSVSSDGTKSSVTEVRLIVECIGHPELIDSCGVCNGDNSTCRYCQFIDRCGVCNGTNACVGCDGVVNSGMEMDDCGVCGGLNLCKGCDHMGGGVMDKCGVCGGDNSTCDPTIDQCNVVGGDGSSCQCVTYHGYHVRELDYLLLHWGIQNSITNIDAALALLDESLTNLNDYDGDADLAAVVKFLNEFNQGLVAPYASDVNTFVGELDVALGITAADSN